MKCRGGGEIMYFENILWQPKSVEDLGYSRKNHIAALNTLIRYKNSDKKSLLSDLGKLEKEMAKIQKKIDDLSLQ
jgi:septal ring factor EnvC (AmiA/AmiB activator)